VRSRGPTAGGPGGRAEPPTPPRGESTRLLPTVRCAVGRLPSPNPSANPVGVWKKEPPLSSHAFLKASHITLRLLRFAGGLDFATASPAPLAPIRPMISAKAAITTRATSWPRSPIRPRRAPAPTAGTRLWQPPLCHAEREQVKPCNRDAA
jgi:hypothetical protein